MQIDQLSRAVQPLWPGIELKQLIGHCENRVYEATLGNQPVILRCSSHTGRRTEAHIQAELDWMIHLSEQGVSVVQPIPTQSETLFNLVNVAGETWFVVLFTRAPGETPTDTRDSAWDDNLRYEWGRQLGLMHAVASRGVPDSIVQNRPTMEEDELVARRRDYTRSHWDGFLPQYEELLNRFDELPKTQSNYGMIHVDLHSANFCWEQGTQRLTMFDFEECCHWHFIYDVAAAAWHETVMWDDPAEAVMRFLPPLLKGYREVTPVMEDQYQFIPDCLHLTDYILATHCVRIGRADETRLLKRILPSCLEKSFWETLNVQQVLDAI